MILYTIRFELHPDKANEFALSWKYFCEHTRETEGLRDCKMMEIPGNCHEISMSWTERYHLSKFMRGDWYTFLQGAVNVLGEKSVITQREVKED